MAENTKIEWATHTQNFWIGCTKCSAGCAHCYAEEMMDKRYGRVAWGKGQERALTSDANWLKPLAWNRAAKEAGACINPYLRDERNPPGSAALRPRVFASSLSDVFDEEVSDEWRDRMFAVIHATPYLDWLLLTKRPHKARDYMTKAREQFIIEARNAMQGTKLDPIYRASVALGISHFPNWHNIWAGTSVENQDAADKRIPELLKVPAKVHFLSCEPMLGPVDLSYWMDYDDADPFRRTPTWVIVGGESGKDARPMHPQWARDLRDQCQKAGVPFFFKQDGSVLARERECKDKKGGEFKELSPEFQIREFPQNGHDDFAAR